MKRNVLVGIAGPTAGGKTTVAKHIAVRLGAHRAKYSDILIEMAQERSLPADKATLQAISNEVRAKYGNDILARELRTKLKTISTEPVVIEGNRLMDDMAFLETLARDHSKELVLLYIDADEDARFMRINSRERSLGNSEMTRGVFDVLEADPCEAELTLVREYISKHHRGYVMDTSAHTIREVLADIDTIMDSICTKTGM